MKQHINSEQLRRFAKGTTFEDFMKLYKLIRNDKETTYNGIKMFYDRLRMDGTVGFNTLLKEINIGKMIEILYKKDDFGISMVKPCATVIFKELEYTEHELVDALWEVVLEVTK